jgi:lysophospholipase L1-like esterase
MRRIRWVSCLLMCLALYSTIPAFASPAYQDAPGGLDVTLTKRAKLRVGPGTEWTFFGYAEAGENLHLDGRAPFTNIWVRATTADGRVAWIFGELVAASPVQLNTLPIVWDGTPITPGQPVEPAPAPTTQEATAVPEESAPVNLAPMPHYDVVSGISRHAREIYVKGQELGNHPNVFSKVGDSITVSPYFLYPFGWGTYNLRGYGDLQAVVNYFGGTAARDGNNSFSNPSLAAYNGITSSGILDPNSAWTQVCQTGESPLECEYRVVKPSIALIMIGTNDVVSVPLETYRANLTRIVQITVDRGIIPVLSLIPTRQGYENAIAAYNQVIADTAAAFDIPLWNFGGSIYALDHNGLSDGIHPSAPPGTAPDDYSVTGDFTVENLRYGYTIRNLTALQVLDAVWRGAMY